MSTLNTAWRYPQFAGMASRAAGSQRGATAALLPSLRRCGRRRLGLGAGVHIGQHAAGDLRQEDIGVDQGFRLEFAVLRANRLEVVADLNQAIHIRSAV